MKKEQQQAAIHIDGSQGEGGGQVLRTALALSILTQKPLHITNIRANRPKTGLMRQHLCCVQAAAQISAAEVHDAALGSAELHFAPQTVQAGDYRFDIGSAGSTMLVLQTILPVLWLADAPSTVELAGGTHNPMAPFYQFIELAYLPLLARIGGAVESSIQRVGFYPAGGGKVRFAITPVQERQMQVPDITERGALVQAYAECMVPGINKSVAERELNALAKGMGWNDPAQLRLYPARQNEGPGNALVAVLQYAHLTEVQAEFGAKNLSSEQVATRLRKSLHRYMESDGALGEHLADQWLLLLALAVCKGANAEAVGRFTCVAATAHLRTNADVIERFLPVRIAIARAESRKGVAVSVRRGILSESVAR